MKEILTDLSISLFSDDKDLLEKLVIHRDEPLPLLMRKWIRNSAHRSGLLTPHAMRNPELRGPTEKTKFRAAAFKKIKDAHPCWNIERVAMEATTVLCEVITAETVRNAYRALGWKWERADRVR